MSEIVEVKSMFQWNQLLCNETLRKKEKVPTSWTEYPKDPFEEDYREIISSVSFRHLQDKAQIYQLEKGDFVRTRLTHSLEVSTTAKQLGSMILYNEKWRRIPVLQEISADHARAIPTVLACAGLLHDLGNPPFGHQGEYAIGHWFATALNRDDFTFRSRPIREVLNEQMCRDLCNFEGNAEGIRMLSKCRFPSEEQEANVSFATMSTMLKYPCSSVDMKPSSHDVREHKFGYFLSERDLVRTIRERTGVVVPGEPYTRNPLTYLLEAADDIAYVASDVEDTVAKHTITVSSLHAFLQEKVEELPQDGDEEHQLRVLTAEGMLRNLTMRLEGTDGDENTRVARFHDWTGYLRNWLMYVAASSFVANIDAIMAGTYQGDLLEESHHRYTIDIMKQQMKTNVYPRLGAIHIAAHTILTDLTQRYASAVVNWDTDQPLDFVSTTYVGMIPDRLKNAYRQEKTGDEAYDLYLRFRMVTDFLSSMTDGDVNDLYKKLNSISY